MVDAGGTPALDVGVRADVEIALPAAPVRLRAAGLGANVGFPLTSGEGSKTRHPDLAALGVTLELPVVAGTGELRRTADDEWVGALALVMPPLAVSAYGILALPRADRPLSFLVVLSARFPPPGIQVGFGFAVSGIGGIFGLARRADVDALTGAVLDGSLGGLLFPTDPEREAPRLVAVLPQLFPSAPGRVLFGPMLELSWGGGLVRLHAAVVVDLPDPPRFILLGRLVIDLPHPALPLVHIEVRFLAAFDPGIPELRIVASLTGSYVIGLTLTGDLFVLVRGGPKATFVLSAGGFHPAVRAPEGVPPLRRVGMSLSIPFVELRYEAYLAITTTSVQFGARVELTASVAGCGVHGWLGLDALFEWVPHFHFSVAFTAGIEVEVFGETLMAVRLDGMLEGPAPWHIRAHGEVEVLFVSVSLALDETFVDVGDVDLARCRHRGDASETCPRRQGPPRTGAGAGEPARLPFAAIGGSTSIIGRLAGSGPQRPRRPWPPLCASSVPPGSDTPGHWRPQGAPGLAQRPSAAPPFTLRPSPTAVNPGIVVSGSLRSWPSSRRRWGTAGR